MDRGHLKELLFSTLEDEDQSNAIANFIVDTLGKEYCNPKTLEIPVNRREIKLEQKLAKEIKVIKFDRESNQLAEENGNKQKLDVFDRVSRKRSFNESTNVETEKKPKKIIKIDHKPT